MRIIRIQIIDHLLPDLHKQRWSMFENLSDMVSVEGNLRYLAIITLTVIYTNGT